VNAGSSSMLEHGCCHVCWPFEILHPDFSSGAVVNDNHGHASVTSPRDRGEALILHERHPSHVVRALIAIRSVPSNTPCHMRIIGDGIFVGRHESNVNEGLLIQKMEGRRPIRRRVAIRRVRCPIMMPNILRNIVDVCARRRGRLSK